MVAQGVSELWGLLKVLWSNSLLSYMEELSPKEENHRPTELVNHSKTRSHASFCLVDTSSNSAVSLEYI